MNRNNTHFYYEQTQVLVPLGTYGLLGPCMQMGLGSCMRAVSPRCERYYSGRLRLTPLSLDDRVLPVPEVLYHGGRVSRRPSQSWQC